MIVFVGHSLVDGAIGLDVDNIAGLVGLEVGRELDGALLTEVSRKEMASACTESERMRHLNLWFVVVFRSEN